MPSESAYPPAHRSDTVDTLHGRSIADPYRWLERPQDPASVAWSQAQAELFEAHRQTWPSRERFRSRLEQLTSVGMVSPPFWAGGRQFFLRRSPGQEHAVLFMGEPDGAERALVDPNAIDPSGATTLDWWYPSKEGTRLAYALCVGGSEQPILTVVDIDSGQVLDGPIDRMRDPSIAWLPGGEAFYYSRFLETSEDGQPWLHRRTYLHVIGAGVEEDVLVIGADAPRGRYFFSNVSHDGRWLTVLERQGTDPRRNVWIADLSASAAASPALKPLQVDVDALTSPLFRGDRLYLLTDRDAPRGRICVAPLDDFSYAAWEELIAAEPGAIIEEYAVLDGLERPLIVVASARHAISFLSIHDTDGNKVGEVELPGAGTVSGLRTDPAHRDAVWFSYTDFTTVAVVYRFDGLTGTLSEWARTPGETTTPKLTSRQVTYHSADGTTIRMFVISAGESVGPRPTILYGYGGFNLATRPQYSAEIMSWVEAGGVYAIANLRGGNEEGEKWHRAGMLDKKQNVFDDFHAAGDWLVDNNIATKSQLAIMGGSNGGLLVGAALTQRPGAYAAVVCSAPLLDMVRYELFGLGMTWSGEYGTVSDPEHLEWLLAYSPYHNVHPGIAYPAVLFTVFDSDSRVDPMHARKMAAALQHSSSSVGRPILLRSEPDVGHGARAISRYVELGADKLSFLASAVSLASPGTSA